MKTIRVNPNDFYPKGTLVIVKGKAGVIADAKTESDQHNRYINVHYVRIDNVTKPVNYSFINVILCSTGESKLFKEEPCNSPANQYLAGVPFCQSCFNKQAKAIAEINKC